MHATDQPGSAAREPQGFDEAVLVERLRAGEEQAFEELVRTQSGRLLAVLARYLPNEADRHDALSEVFLAAVRGIGGLEGGAQLSTWLHRIAVNAALMMLRTRRRRPAGSLESLLPRFREDGHAADPPAPWHRREAGGIEAAEEAVFVRSCIDELPDGFREVLLLRDVEGLSTEAAASALGLTAGAVKTRLHRARQALRTLLDRRYRGGTP